MAKSHPDQGVASADNGTESNKSTDCRFCERTFDSYAGRRKHEGQVHKEPYQDEETLRKFYWDKGLSMDKISNVFDVPHSTIQYWIEKHEIDTRGVNEHQERVGANYRLDSRGYQTWSAYVDDNNQHVQVHRLLAVAEYGFDAVCDMDVHHVNGISWDNRPGNIDLLTRGEHTRLHQLEK